MADVTVKAANMVEIFDGTTNICDKLSSQDGNACPSEGEYEIKSFDFALPGDGDSWYAQHDYWGMSIGIKATFDINGSKTVCNTKVTLSKNSGYSMAYSAVIALAGVSLLIGFRRRRVAKIQLDEEEGTQTHFEMMRSDGRVIV